MNRVILKLLFLIILPAFEVSLAAQSSLQEESNVQIPDSCKPVIKNDTTFYPRIKIDPGTLVDYEEMPEFPGGEKALIAFVRANTVYPVTAIKDSVSGQVVVKFVVGTGGCPADFSILKGIREDLDNESIRVARRLPKFRPGSTVMDSPKGLYRTNVKVWYIVTFKYRLKESPDEKGIIILPRKEAKK
jgi:hypothetical protein